MSSFLQNNSGSFHDIDPGSLRSGRDSQNREQTAIEYAIRSEEESVARAHRLRFGSGASLILMVLIIISIVCFAALSIVSAQADSRLTDHMQEQTDAWRAASNAGQYDLAEADAGLREIYRSVTASGDSARERYFAAAEDLDGFYDLSDPAAAHYIDVQDVLANTDTDPETAVILVYTSAISDNQDYLLIVQVLWPDDNDGRRFRILSSKSLSTADYSYDTGLNVMK